MPQLIWQISAVALGGAAGASLRFLVGKYISETYDWGFPIATLLVNLVGSFAFGVLFMVISQRFAMDSMLRLTLLVGFLGALTTFSTFSFEVVRLLQSGHLLMALSYVLISVSVCVLATWLGIVVVR